MKIEQYWAEFLRLTGRDASIKYAYYFYFGYNEALANELLALVLVVAQISANRRKPAAIGAAGVA